MGFLITLFGRKEKASSSVAKERLLEVLIHDRIKLPPATMDQIRQEILAVLSKYIDVDREGMEVSITRADGGAHLTANIPIKRGEALRLSDEESGYAGGSHALEPGPNLSNRKHAAESSGRNSSGGTASSGSAPRTSPPPQQFGPQRKRRH